MKAKIITYIMCTIVFFPIIQISGQTKYAILINTGYSKEENSKDYYDELVRIYDYLLNEYNYNEQDIYIYNADGTDEADDHFCGYYLDQTLYCNSDPDMDGDGDYDITGEASEDNINDKLLDLQSVMSSNDFLFIYLTGPVYHVFNEEILICDYYGAGLTFWESDRAHNNALATNMNGINNGDVFFVDARSEDGIDIEDYEGNRRYIMKNNTFELMNSPGCDFPMSSSYYMYFMDALIGENKEGDPVFADFDGSGNVSLMEAKKYADMEMSGNQSEVFWSDILRAKNMTLNGYIGCQSINLLHNNYFISVSQSLSDCYFDVKDMEFINSNISIIANNDITFQSNVLVDNDSNLVLEAGRNVVIQAGFVVNTGSTLIIH